MDKRKVKEVVQHTRGGTHTARLFRAFPDTWENNCASATSLNICRTSEIGQGSFCPTKLGLHWGVYIWKQLLTG